MYRFILLFISILPPLSIWAQTDSLKAAKNLPYNIFQLKDSVYIISYPIEYEGERSFNALKSDNLRLVDSLKKGLLPDWYNNKVAEDKKRLVKQKQERDSTLKAIVRTPIPDFDAPDTMGIIHRPANYRGRVLLLHFFNFWDSSFENEIPVLNNLMERYNGKGLEILSFMDIGMTDSERKVLKEKPINFPLVTNARLFMKNFLPVDKHIPYVVLVDKAGHFRYFYLKNVINANKRNDPNGAIGQKERLITFDDWEEKIVQLLDES